MRNAFLISVVFILVVPATAHAQPFDTMYDGSPLFTGATRLSLLVGPGGNHALPCSLFGSRTMRKVPTPYCLSDSELAEERQRVRSIIGNPTPPPAVAQRQRQAFIPPPAGRRAVAAPLQPETRKLFRVESRTPRTAAGRSVRPAATMRPSLAAYRVGMPAPSGVASGTPAPRPALAGTPDEEAGGRAQRIP